MLKKSILSILVFTLFSCKQAPDLSVNTTQDSITAYDLTFNQKNIRYFISAHRGGKGYMGYPENCLETIDFLLGKDIKIFEIDITTTKDGKLVLLHDDDLRRTTTGNGNINNFTFEELKLIYLVDDYKKTTEFKIPLLENILNFAKKNEIVLMLDFKKSVSYKEVIDLVKKTATEKNVVLISYNQNQAEKLHQLAPEMMLSVSIRNQEEYDRHIEKGIPNDRMIAFVGVREPKKEHYDFLHQKGIMTILGTLGNLDKRAASKGNQIYEQFFKNGADIVSSDRAVEAQKTINLIK
ncbi:MAG: glycerophosphodiester phosphodiesterase family protein [Flavobacteriales bacterium]